MIQDRDDSQSKRGSAQAAAHRSALSLLNIEHGFAENPPCGKTSLGHLGTQSRGCAGQTVRPSLNSISQTSAGTPLPIAATTQKWQRNRLKVDVIVTAGSALLAVKQATSVIPIVFAVAGEPVGSSLVASLARPGGNITGLSTQRGETGGKRLGLLRELLPGLRRLAILGDVGVPESVLEMS